jgi:hypothetical protein
VMVRESRLKSDVISQFGSVHEETLSLRWTGLRRLIYLCYLNRLLRSKHMMTGPGEASKGRSRKRTRIDHTVGDGNARASGQHSRLFICQGESHICLFLTISLSNDQCIGMFRRDYRRGGHKSNILWPGRVLLGLPFSFFPMDTGWRPLHPCTIPTLWEYER